LSLIVGLALAQAHADDQGSKDRTDLYDRPVLSVDPGTHTAKIWAQAVDAGGRFAVTGSDDRTVRIWSVADGKLLRTIWVPGGPDPVGAIYAVAISPDGSTIAAGGYMEQIVGDSPIYIFDRETGDLIRRIHGDLPDTAMFLTFSPDGRYLAVALATTGLRIFDRDKDWTEAFRDDRYQGGSLGATFSPDGRLMTTAFDGLIRLYAYDATSNRPNFRRVGEPLKAPSGDRPRDVAFCPDSKRLAVGYDDAAAVDVLDGATLKRLGGHRPADVRAVPDGLFRVAWSHDCQTLLAAGTVRDTEGRVLLFAWGEAGLGDERRMTYCGPEGASGVDTLPNSRILVASGMPCLGLMDADGKPVWTVISSILDTREQTDVMRVAQDGRVVDFGYESEGAVFRFDVRSLTLSGPPPSGGLTFPPSREGLTIDGWQDAGTPTLGGQALRLEGGDVAYSLAIAPDAKSFFLGSGYALAAFDDAGKQKWRRPGRGEARAVNASRDGRIVVAAHGDGTIRWHRADDGRELLALQVLLNKSDPIKSDWVLWTPEGFYEATPGAQDVLRWVVNHGPEKAATTLPVSAIPKLHRPSALPLVLDELETARALGIDDISTTRLEVQAKTGSAKPPGAVLHVLAIGVDHFGDKAGGLHLDYAAEDARDVADMLRDSQKIAPGKPSLYADVKVTYLPNDQASNTAIRDALDDMADGMKTSDPDQDVAVILVSSHGELIDGQFYLVPYGVDIGSKNKIIASALSASDFAKKVQDIAKHGKVLLLLDSCHSGAVGPGGWATDPDAKVLRDAMNMENVTVLTSYDKNGLSEELPGWAHGALAQAFLDALTGAADAEGIVRLTALTDAMDNELRSLTNRRQSLGMHVNFGGDLFVANHY
jgi:WD40 repeat protein